MGTPEAKALSKKNKDIQKKNPYPHYIGRGGYDMLQRELVAASQATTSADIWFIYRDGFLARMGGLLVQLKKEVAAGTFVPDGHNDVLTRALGTAKDPGRTRGVGSYSGLLKFFKGNMKPRKPEGNYMTEEDLLQRLPSLLQHYGVCVSGGALDFASMSEHTPSVAPHYGQRSSKESTDFVDFADLTDVAACYLRISDPADYIVTRCSPPSSPETVADCEGSFVAWPKSLVGLGDSPVHTARHGNFSSRKSRPILGIRPIAPSSPVQDVVDRSSYVSFVPRYFSLLCLILEPN
ncbi:unnamed protein product [Cuscuta campestris]|uniref:Uncharacterized protein n=1 Tax=Cuscuta campestris TaxID=132261 RepID=A0A484KYM2_9ASTE|nr:unnamed protein product [Cuscuta campestris]